MCNIEVDHRLLSDLKVENFAEVFGAKVDDFSAGCKELIEQMDFRHHVIEGRERDRVILDVLKAIESGDLTVSGRQRKDDWEKGWGENLQRFIDSDYDLSSLVPVYYQTHQILRLQRDYIRHISASFVVDWYTVYRRFFFEKYLSDYDCIYEFGCGTGLNLVMMAELFPDKDVHGSDWVAASKEIVDTIAKVYHYNIKGHVFDLFSPVGDFEVRDNSAIVTLNSLEQIGADHEPFIQFVLTKAPTVCINWEPLIELYDESDLLDYLAIRYHRKRGYLEGYLTRLRELESEGTVEILKTQRICFGSMYQEGFSFVIWRPKT
ncbi:hypothetical protein ACFL5Z_00280 [Planctomycetota bacterium]